MAPKRQPTVRQTTLGNIMRQAEREGLETVEMYDADDHALYRPLLIQEAGSVEEAQRRGWLNAGMRPDNPDIKVNAAGRAKWAELQGNVMSGARQSAPGPSAPGPSAPGPSAPGPSQRRRAYSDDDDDDYSAFHTPRGEITPRGPAYPTGDEANNALIHLQLNYDVEWLVRSDYLDYDAIQNVFKLKFSGLEKYRADYKTLVLKRDFPSKFDAAYNYCLVHHKIPPYMFKFKDDNGEINYLLTMKGLEKYEEAQYKAQIDASEKQQEAKQKAPPTQYEPLIKKALDVLDKNYNQYLDKQKTQTVKVETIEHFYNKSTKPVFDELTKRLHDEITFDEDVLMDSRLYLHGLIEKGTNERMNKILRMVMNTCIIPPIPRGKRFKELDSKTKTLYDVAVNANNFVVDYTDYAHNLRYVNLGNIKETMKNWRIWYNDQDDADDKKYKGFDISGYIIRTGNLPTTLNVESGQAVEPVQTYGTTYRINFYYPNPWEASGTIKYFDVVLA
jgi:hypothetical protein